MMKPLLISIFLILAITLTACSQQHAVNDSISTRQHETESVAGDTDDIEKSIASDNGEFVAKDNIQEEKELILSINGTEVSVNWEDNESVAELISYTQNESIMVNTTIYGGFEQVGSLPQRFSRNDVQMTTEPGDVVLYSGNQLVLFFGSNSWSYTKLGHIEELSVEELSELLGGSEAKIVIQ